MPLLLLICLTLACLPIEWPAPYWGGELIDCAYVAVAHVGVMLVVSGLISRNVVRQLRRCPDKRHQISRTYGLRRLGFFFLNLSSLALLLLVGGWGWAIREWFTHDQLYLPGAEVVLLSPYLLSLFGSWAMYYDAERALHQSATGARESSPYWSRLGYVLYVARFHVLLVFLPVALTISQMGVLRLFPDLMMHPVAKVSAFLAVIVFVVMMPSIVPVVLGLRRMPDGPIRSRLEASARRLGVRYRELYVWETRKSLATAMVVGLIPRFRYIVFSDLLLLLLTDEEIEGVFGHEAGHVKHRHLIYYVLFLFLSFAALGAVYRAIELEFGDSWLPRDWSLALAVIATGAYLFVVFGLLSRRCERQADVFGCKALSCESSNCQGHDDSTILATGGQAICRTGIQAFARALDKVEDINGLGKQSATRRRGPIRWATSALQLVSSWLGTWQHSTIDNRTRFLRDLAANPGLEPRFQRRITIWRWGIVLILLGVLAGTAAWQGWRALVEGI